MAIALWLQRVFVNIHPRHSRGGENVEIAAAISKVCGKGGKDIRTVFPMLSMDRHFHGLFRPPEYSGGISRPTETPFSISLTTHARIHLWRQAVYIPIPTDCPCMICLEALASSIMLSGWSAIVWETSLPSSLPSVSASLVKICASLQAREIET